jgi:hypothetical protein
MTAEETTEALRRAEAERPASATQGGMAGRVMPAGAKRRTDDPAHGGRTGSRSPSVRASSGYSPSQSRAKTSTRELFRLGAFEAGHPGEFGLWLDR